MFTHFQIFGRDIYTYGLLAGIGLVLAGLYAMICVKRRKRDENDMVIVLLVAAAGVIVGGHLLYGITQIPYIPSRFSAISNFPQFISFLSLTFGGSVFYGGLIGGVGAGMLYLKLKKLDFQVFTDVAAPTTALFHGIARIGCFLGGCCYGVESSWGFITHSNHLNPSVNGVVRFPVQLFEAGFELILFATLAFLLYKGILKGKLYLIYLVTYSVGRFILEFFRGDEYRGLVPFFGTSWLISTSQVISIIIFATCLPLLIISIKKDSRRCEGCEEMR